jgi:transcriptional regulator with XRE-family HTH domain
VTVNRTHGDPSGIITRLIRERHARGWSERQAADKAGLARATVFTIEARGNCTLLSLHKLAAIYGLKLVLAKDSADTKGGKRDD